MQAPITLSLPPWTAAAVAEGGDAYPDTESRMRLAIRLASLNVAHETGGPFGAAIFESESGRVLAVGVNRVVTESCSVAHAEMMAIMGAQQSLGVYDLGGEGLPAYELVSSTEPCAMCMGAIPWSGVRRLVCGARDEDARAVGFDEGPKPEDWIAAYLERGIEVVHDVLREDAASVLRSYTEAGGPAYNARQG